MKKRIVTIMTALALVLTAFPMMPGNDVNAASPYFRSFSASTYGQTGTSISWKKLSKKQQRKVKGIAIFRNGRVIARISKRASSYKDGNLNPGKKYTYQIKTYKTKKVKRWYNKKTGKLQKKRPAKKYRGKAKKITTYTYSNASIKKAVALRALPSYSRNDFDDEDSDEYENNIGGNNSSTDGNSSTTGENSSTAPSNPANPTTVKKTVTDYLGNTWTIEDLGGGDYRCTDKNGYHFVTDSLAKVDRTAPGEFINSDGDTMVQVNGATINKTKIKVENTNSTYSIPVRIYNGDANKLDFIIDRPTETVDTRVNGFKHVTLKYVMKDGYRLTECSSTPVIKTKMLNANTTLITKTMGFGNLEGNLLSCGFVSGDINVTIAYNGKKIKTVSFNPNPTADSNGMHPFRAFYLDIALTAIREHGGSTTFEEDMGVIAGYVYRNYEYPPKGSTEGGIGPNYFNCIGGADVLETYAIYKGHYGYFATPPGKKPDHLAFYLDEDVEHTKPYEAQGYQVPGKEY